MTINVNSFKFNAIGELTVTPQSYNWYDLQQVYTFLIDSCEYISASRIQHLSNFYYPEISTSLYIKKGFKVMNTEHVILDSKGVEQGYLVPDCIPFFLDDDEKINENGLSYFLRATKLLKAIDKNHAYITGNDLDRSVNDFGNIDIFLVKINDIADKKLVATIWFLD